MSSIDEADRQTLANWGDLKVPHGRQEDAHGVFRKRVTALEGLPKESTHIHLVFPYFWRDFRSLRGMSNKYSLSQYHVTFQFPRDRDTHPLSDSEQRFFVAQTMAAVSGVIVAEQANIDKARREDLVRIGCRGFNIGQRQ
jgi:hypothetical protein